jgi:TolA-binding protein
VSPRGRSKHIEADYIGVVSAEPLAAIIRCDLDIQTIGVFPMADNADDKPTAARVSSKADDDNAMETMQKQLAQMRREISALKRALADQAEEVIEDAESWFDSASEGASRATRAVRAQAQTVSDAVQGNPGTVSSALVVGGIIGLVVGMALGRSEAPHRRWYERH